MNRIEPNILIAAGVTIILVGSVYFGAVQIRPLRAPPAEQAVTFTAIVKKVHDGDTLTVKTPNNKVQKLRLWGVDSPELYQSYGQIVRYRVTRLLAESEVTVEVKDKDKYGRYVAQVRLKDGRDLGTLLVKEGLAWWYRRHAEDATFLQKAEEEARRRKRGLWERHEPEPPWEWRAQHARRH